MPSSKINIFFFSVIMLGIAASILLLIVSVDNLKVYTNSFYEETAKNLLHNHAVDNEIDYSTKISKIAPGSDVLNLDEGKWILGKWQGAANQFDDNSKWTIVVTKQPESKYFTVEYPSIGCNGYLDLITISSKSAELRELIISGDCVNNVRIVIAKINNKKAYYRAYWPEDNQLNAEGILRKVE